MAEFTGSLRDTFQKIGNDISALRLRSGGFYFRNNSGVFEKSTDGTTWTPVSTGGSATLPDVDFVTDFNNSLNA